MAKHVLSIEIGTLVTKIVEIDYKKKNPHVYRAVSFATPEGVIEDGVIRDKDVLAVAFRNELAEAGMKERNVVFSIASSKIATREVTLPNVKENKIGALVQATAQEYFPIDLNDYTLAYSLLETIKEGKDKSYKVLLLAAPDDLVDNYYNFAKEMDFNIEALDYFGNGSMQVLKKEIVLDYCACIQISGNTTMINFMNEGQQLMQRTIPQGIFNVAEAMVLSEDCMIEDMDTACEALCRDKLVCRSLDYRGLDDDDSIVSARMTEEQWRQQEASKSARKVVTDAIGEILLSVDRVIDFFKSKYQGVELTRIYITGMGSKVAGIEELFQSVLNVETQRMEHLVNVSFPRHFSEGLYNQTEYIAVIGAAIGPVGFKSKNAAVAGAGADGLRNAQLVFGLAVICAVAMSAFSLVTYNTEKTRNDDLNARKASLSSINQVFEENEGIKSVYDQVNNLQTSTETQNENLNGLLKQLEGSLPRTMTVTFMQSSQDGINLTITSETDISIARMLMNLEALEMRNKDGQMIPVLTNISIPSVTASEEDDGSTVYNFTVSAQYYQAAQAAKAAEEQKAAAAAAENANTSDGTNNN
ncbi:MAG: pilus assembly protein PilM [Lachnospiraceae bacterium]|nr:pilus assembly protein PilM [Lachnospiraceae bacterium]